MALLLSRPLKSSIMKFFLNLDCFEHIRLQLSSVLVLQNFRFLWFSTPVLTKVVQFLVGEQSKKGESIVDNSP